MANATQNRTVIEPVILEREYYVERSALFGLLTWKEVVKREVISNELHILTQGEPSRVVINHFEYVPKPTKKTE